MDNAHPGDVRVAIAGEDDIVLARGRARNLAKDLGFGVVDQSRIATAVSELTRNVVRYATDGRGEAILRALAPSPRAGIEIVVRDTGPGIEDVARAMEEGYTTGRGMGIGLPGTKRLMDEMEIRSTPGVGTVVTVRKWRT